MRLPLSVFCRVAASLSWMLVAAMAATGAAAPPSFDELAARARRGGHDRLADTIASWTPPDHVDRIAVVRIESQADGRCWSDPPEWAAGGDAVEIWRVFIEARRAAAGRWLAKAVESARQPAAGREGTMWTLFRAVREDPDLPEARAAIGWVRREERWVWPPAARRIDRGEIYEPAFGWLPKARLLRYRAGERYVDGRWLDAAEAVKPRSIGRGWRSASDHWEITSSVPPERAMALAARLEETRMVWLQAFGGFAVDDAEILRRIEGRARAEPRSPFAVSLVGDRREYAAALEPLEPSAGRSLGLYWNPTRTAWFFDADEDGRGVGPASSTVLHESTHQLFAESRRTTPLAGERCGFWALEAVACFMESLEPTAFGWTLGGPNAGRVPMARERIVEDGFHVPLRELCGMGRRDLQADPRLPMIYSEISGLAEFFLVGGRGRHREAFIEYLRRIYAGTVEPDTLASLCERTFEELDDDYRRFMASIAPSPSR